MYYLITNQNDMTWRDRLWGPDVTHEVTNFNYYFEVYDHIPTALFMQPAYEDIKNPKIWECSIDNPNKTSFITMAPKVTTHKTVDFPEITKQQRITFAILCCLQIVQNPIFREWALNYLNSIDTSEESAKKTQEKLMAQMGSEEIPEEHDYISCAHACLEAVFKDDVQNAAANSAHRAFYDSPHQDRINLQQLAEIALTVSPKDIAELLGH